MVGHDPRTNSNWNSTKKALPGKSKESGPPHAKRPMFDPVRENQRSYQTRGFGTGPGVGVGRGVPGGFGVPGGWAGIDFLLYPRFSVYQSLDQHVIIVEGAAPCKSPMHVSIHYAAALQRAGGPKPFVG